MLLTKFIPNSTIGRCSYGIDFKSKMLNCQKKAKVLTEPKMPFSAPLMVVGMTVGRGGRGGRGHLGGQIGHSMCVLIEKE